MFPFSKTFQYKTSKVTFYTDDVFKIPDEWEKDTSLAIWENVEFIFEIFYDWYRTHVFVGEKKPYLL